MSQFYSGQNGCFIAKHPMSMQQVICIKEGDIVQLDVKALHKYTQKNKTPLSFVTSKYIQKKKMYVLLNDANETVLFNMENVRIEQIGNGLISFVNDNGKYAMRFELNYHETATALCPTLFGDASKMFFMRHKAQTLLDFEEGQHKFTFIYNTKTYEVCCPISVSTKMLFSDETLPDDVKSFIKNSVFNLVSKNRWIAPDHARWKNDTCVIKIKELKNYTIPSYGCKRFLPYGNLVVSDGSYECKVLICEDGAKQYFIFKSKRYYVRNAGSLYSPKFVVVGSIEEAAENFKEAGYEYEIQSNTTLTVFHKNSKDHTKVSLCDDSKYGYYMIEGRIQNIKDWIKEEK